MKSKVQLSTCLLSGLACLGVLACGPAVSDEGDDGAGADLDGKADGLGPERDEHGRPVDWKLLFNQLFALEIRKEHGAASLDELLAEHTHYSPRTFNEAIEACSSARTSVEAFEARRRFFEDPANRRLISELDFSRSIGRSVRRRPDVGRFLATIEQRAGRAIPSGENFFASPEGQNAIAAFAATNDEVAFVMVPGYAAHTIKFYIFEELVKDANTYYGRPAERPVLAEDGIDLRFQDHVSFYGAHNDRPNHFDVLHPVGVEMGNTAGRNAETTDLMYEWIRSLPPEYARKKLILLGYSKGAPIVLDLVSRHPELADRIIGFVTYGGVVQGTNVARSGLEQASELLRDRTMDELVDRLQTEDPESLSRILSPLFSHLDVNLVSWPKLRELFDIFEYDLGPFERTVHRLQNGREVRELLDGMTDLSPLERVRWNLLHLDNDTFRRPVVTFNLSAVTNIESFVEPRSLLAPTFRPDGSVDWSQLSLDAIFLYTSSIEGFKTAPGGLFDTQVELGNTKLPQLDTRPLAASLTDAEIDALWSDPRVRAQVARSGVTTRDQLAHRPRRELVRFEHRDNLDAIDLGEIRGHHWNTFVQALRPPADVSTEHAVWTFPRKAYMRALVQTMALHQLITR